MNYIIKNNQITINIGGEQFTKVIDPQDFRDFTFDENMETLKDEILDFLDGRTFDDIDEFWNELNVIIKQYSI